MKYVPLLVARPGKPRKAHSQVFLGSRLRRRRILSRRNLFEPLEPRVLLSGTDPYISLGPAAASGTYYGYTGEYVEIPIRIDQTGPSSDGNNFQGLRSALVQISFSQTFFNAANVSAAATASTEPPTSGSAPVVIWGPLADASVWTAQRESDAAAAYHCHCY